MENSRPLIINTDFSDMSLRNLPAESYNFTSHDCIIYADTLQGEVTVNGYFGNIELFSQDEVILNVENQDGNIYFQGLLSSEAALSVHSSSGGIEFHIPADSLFDVVLSSDFGKIETEFSLNRICEINPNKMEGQINSGGPLLTLESKMVILPSILRTTNSHQERSSRRYGGISGYSPQ